MIGLTIMNLTIIPICYKQVDKLCNSANISLVNYYKREAK